MSHPEKMDDKEIFDHFGVSLVVKLLITVSYQYYYSFKKK